MINLSDEEIIEKEIKRLSPEIPRNKRLKCKLPPMLSKEIYDYMEEHNIENANRAIRRILHERNFLIRKVKSLMRKIERIRKVMGILLEDEDTH